MSFQPLNSGYPTCRVCLSFCLLFVWLDFASGANPEITVFETEQAGILVSIDPRVEFLQTLLILADHPHINTSMTDYKLAILEQYGNRKGSAELDTFQRLAQKAFQAVDEPYHLLVHCTRDWQLKKGTEAYENLNTASNAELLACMNRLWHDMDYPAFFNSQSMRYSAILEVLKFSLRDFQEKERMLSYYRTANPEQFTFHLLLNILGKGNFGQFVAIEDTQSLYAIIAPEGQIGDLPIFDLQGIHYLVWHEFSHSFVNPWVDQYNPSFQASGRLLKPIASSMAAQGYQDWTVVIKEHAVRAITCRLARQKFGEEMAHLLYIEPEIGRKFIYLPHLLDLLEQWESGEFANIGEVVLQFAAALDTTGAGWVEKALKETARIRQPDVSELPYIGEARHKPLFVLPEWSGSVSGNLPWPGQPMTKHSNGWYSFSLGNEKHINIIFHDGRGTQTADLRDVSGQRFYDWNSRSWIDKAPDDVETDDGGAEGNVVYLRVPERTDWIPYLYLWRDAKDESFEDFIVRYSANFEGAEIVDDERALEMDIRGRDLVLFGNRENNTFIREYYSDIPVILTAGKLVADRVYNGEGVLFITSWIHPNDPDRASELYLSASPASLSHIDQIPRGGTHFVVANSLVTLHSGNYQRRMNLWRY